MLLSPLHLLLALTVLSSPSTRCYPPSGAVVTVTPKLRSHRFLPMQDPHQVLVRVVGAQRRVVVALLLGGGAQRLEVEALHHVVAAPRRNLLLCSATTAHTVSGAGGRTSLMQHPHVRTSMTFSFLVVSPASLAIRLRCGGVL